MVKLIVTDMDGTLLDDHRNLPKDIWNAIDELNAKGILFAVASGRQYQTLADIFEPVRDRMLFMAENGTIVVYKSEQLSISPIQPNIVQELIAIARNLEDCYPVLCCATTAYVETSDEKLLKKAGDYFHHLQIVDDLTTVTDDVLKFSVCDFGGPSVNSFPAYQSFMDRGLATVTLGNSLWLDIMPPGANKGTALKAMQDVLGISNSETLVFGDYLNDTEMMLHSENSYAMINAHPDILAISKFRTQKDNNHDGVLDTLRGLGLLS